jgi:hypothetical protein
MAGIGELGQISHTGSGVSEVPPLAGNMSTYNGSWFILDQVIPALRENGLEVLKSFDLQEARRDHLDCACPHHDSALCNCQVAVFLIYGIDREPVTLLFHSRDGGVELSMVDDPAHPTAQRKIDRILQALSLLR